MTAAVAEAVATANAARKTTGAITSLPPTGPAGTSEGLREEGAMASSSRQAGNIQGQRSSGTKMRASATAMERTKSQQRVTTRWQQKQAREKEEKLRQTTQKLLSSSRKIVEEQTDRPAEQPSYDEPEESIVGNFSSHDLIRHNIANPNVFDDPVDLITNDLQVIPANEPIPSTTAEPSSSWSFSLNPFHYMQRAETQDKVTATRPEPTRRTSVVGRVESIGDELNAQPQCSSTPN